MVSLEKQDVVNIKIQHQIEQAAKALLYYSGDIAGRYLYRAGEPIDIVIHITDPNDTPIIEFTTKILPYFKD